MRLSRREDTPSLIFTAVGQAHDNTPGPFIVVLVKICVPSIIQA
jgi:hypothetical protein